MVIPGLPPELKRLATVYEFIPPEQFAQLGIDPEDVPLGSFPAHNHPPFLPDRFGGNAYGLGLFEYSALSPEESRILEELDFSSSRQLSDNHSQINDIMKRLGLLIRFTAKGLPFYLIPRQYIIHFSAEIQAKADWIEKNLAQLQAKESAGVGIIANQADLLLSELQTRLPWFNFIHLDSLEVIRAQGAFLQAIIMLNPPAEIDFFSGIHKNSGFSGEHQYNTACFAAGQLHDILDDNGLLLLACDSPRFGRGQSIKVQFHGQDEYKRFLLFSHMYKTRQRYNSSQGLSMTIHSTDFFTFLTAQGLYFESMESMLGGKSLPQVTPPEIDSLPYQDITLPLSASNSLEQLAYWQKCFSPYFNLELLENTLPALQEKFWQEKYSIQASWPQTLLVGIGRRRPKQVHYADLENDSRLKFLIGCPPELLAPYKNTFTYVLKTLEVVRQVYERQYPGLSERGQRMLLGAFEAESSMVQDAKRLISRIPELKQMERQINPQGILGVETPMLESLEKLGMLGLDQGVLKQIYLTVLGHSTLGRVCLGKLSEQTLAPLADVHNYSSLEEAISTINLCRLFSFAETAASDYISKHSNLMAEIFAMSLATTRVVIDPYTSWEDIEREREAVSGGLKNLVVTKLLKLLNLFDFVNNWAMLVEAGPYQQEVLTNFDHTLQEKAGQVAILHDHILQFLETFYVNDPHSQPYFFRALLACHVHGVSRLLPRLGARAAFNLLWMCVHVSDVRVINLNLLPNPHNSEQISRFNKLRQNLEAMPLSVLAPAALNDLRQSMLQQKEVYVQDTGIYFTLDEELGVLVPGFLDPVQALQELKWETQLVSKQSLERSSDQQLKTLDSNYDSLDRYYKASPHDGDEFLQVKTMFLQHIMDQLLLLPEFAGRLQRLHLCCPHLLGELLYKPVQAKQELPIQAAAKLDAILKDSLEDFQNMQFSYEAAIVEFGPSATGIVGVSKLQFAYLAQKLQTALHNDSSLHMALIIAILLSAAQRVDDNLPESFRPHLDMLSDERVQKSLRFLLATQNAPWLIISGQAPINSLRPLLAVDNHGLLSAAFILSIIYTACRQEGLLTEDLLEYFLIFWRRLEVWRNENYDARMAQLEELERHNMFRQAFDKYLQERDNMGMLPNLEDLKISRAVSEPGREIYRLAAMDRLLRLCGCYFAESMDLLMFLQNIPAAFIYRNKRLRSLGLASFSKELEDAASLAHELDNQLGEFILDSLSDFDRPVFISHFTEAAQKLEPELKINLLALGLLAFNKAFSGQAQAVCIDYVDLLNLDNSRLNLLKHILADSSLEKMLHKSTGLKGLSRYSPGMTITVEKNTVRLGLADVVRLDHIIASLDSIDSSKRLRTIYRREIERLDQVWPEAADSLKQQLQQAYQARRKSLVDNLLDDARLAMRSSQDIKSLTALLDKFRKQALDMPDQRLAMLGDLYAFNLERIQTEILQKTARQLATVNSQQELDALWRATIPQLEQPGIDEYDNSLSMSLAAFFDRRARELGS